MDPSAKASEGGIGDGCEHQGGGPYGIKASPAAKSLACTDQQDRRRAFSPPLTPRLTPPWPSPPDPPTPITDRRLLTALHDSRRQSQETPSRHPFLSSAHVATVTMLLLNTMPARAKHWPKCCATTTTTVAPLYPAHDLFETKCRLQRSCILTVRLAQRCRPHGSHLCIMATSAPGGDLT